MTKSTANVAGERLRTLIERIERLEEEKANIGADIREIYAEAKHIGFDTKAMRQIVRLRKMGQRERQEQEEIVNLYLSALGEFSS